MVIYIISDGKKDHLSQTRGLAAALIARAEERQPGGNHSCHEVDITRISWLGKLFYKGKDLDLPRPHLILCAGHGTHMAALSLARHLRALCMVCMKPSLPMHLFDLCIVPKHDLPNATDGKHIFLTTGVINSITPHPEVPKRETLVLIGGPRKQFQWDTESVITQLNTIIGANAGAIVLTTSRRTPADFVQDVTSACPSIRIEPLSETGPTWVADHLACAREVWVTQDSVSMVHEALSSGSPVGILEIKRWKDGDPPSRLERGLEMLIKDGSVNTFTEWAKTHTLPSCKNILNEAGRTADYILEHFPQLLP